MHYTLNLPAHTYNISFSKPKWLNRVKRIWRPPGGQYWFGVFLIGFERLILFFLLNVYFTSLFSDVICCQKFQKTFIAMPRRQRCRVPAVFLAVYQKSCVSIVESFTFSNPGSGRLRWKKIYKNMRKLNELKF